MKKFSLIFLIMVLSFFRLTSEDLGALNTSQRFIQLSEERSEKIEREIKERNGHPWAGNYYYGDGLGVNVSLWIAPKNGFVVTWHGCVGLYALNYGPVVETSDLLKLTGELPKYGRKTLGGFPREYIHVLWGARSYLVSDTEMAGFCNEINAGIEPRQVAHGHFFIRNKDYNEKVFGFPEIPERFRPYLLKEEIQGTVTRTGKVVTRWESKWKLRDMELKLDKGRKQGLLPGMTLFVREPSRAVGMVTITSVTDDEAKGLIVQMLPQQKVKPGWKFSTKMIAPDLLYEISGP